MHTSRINEATGWLLAFRGSELLLTESGELPEIESLRHFSRWFKQVQRVGDYRGKPCYCAVLATDTPVFPGTCLRHLKKLLDELPQDLGHLAGRALELIEWDHTHRYCGVCGAPTTQRDDAIVRVCTNQACRREHYPRISPVVIVAVERGPEILLGRSPRFPPGMYSALAGFVDAGESVEAAVHREIHEESGLFVRNLRYFSSQPWPFPHSLMLGFHADYADGEIVVQADELEDVAFFHVDRLPPNLPGPSTIAHWLIRDFCRRQGRRFGPGPELIKSA